MKNKVGYYRNKLNISTIELSKITGLSQSSITQIENGETRDVMLSTAVKLSKALHVDVYELFCISK